MVQVSLKKWSELNETERKLARTLGITPKESQLPAKRTSPLFKPKPCVIQANVSCILCNSKTIQHFHMELKEDTSYAPYLQSLEVTRQKAKQLGKEIPLRSQNVEQSTCSVCTKVLGSWTKQELVRKLIEVFPIARAAMITGGKPHRRRW